MVEDGQLQPAAPTPPVLPKSAAADPDVRGPFRVLLAGVGERGQPQVAGALLQLLGSSVNLAAVSLAQIVIAGCGDSALGCISTVRQAAQRSASSLLSNTMHIRSRHLTAEASNRPQRTAPSVQARHALIRRHAHMHIVAMVQGFARAADSALPAAH